MHTGTRRERLHRCTRLIDHRTDDCAGVILIVTHASRAELLFAATIDVLEVDVADDPKRAVDEVASGVDDLTTRVEELEVDPAAGEHAKELGRLRLALEEASAAVDAVEENMDGEEDERSRNR